VKISIVFTKEKENGIAKENSRASDINLFAGSFNVILFVQI
jgi:hypothetical protein